MFDLTGKSVLVAGGAGYLCAPVCKGLAEQGASVMIADINSERAAGLVQEIRSGISGANVKSIYLDATDGASSKNSIAQTVKEFGRLDVLINATYKGHGKTWDELTIEEFDTALHANVTSAFEYAREAYKIMPDGGNIIMFSSMYGMVAPDPRIYLPPMKPNAIEYGVCKAAIVQMVKYLAVAWAPRNIRVNGIVPGPFPISSTQKEAPDFIERLAHKVPLGRIGGQDEIAGAVVYLCSNEASYVTGHHLVVDGGWTIW
ncbi:MAG: SDR family oxidoreductase [Phycisphaerae bacterium]|jgi:NAD(P)-dependent dehydrogenase (short-subunit alcohol dehydrogenase family)